MIVPASTHDLMAFARRMVSEHAYVRPTADMQAILWKSPSTGEFEWVVAYDGFIGQCCQMHVVNLKGKPAPRKMLWACFHYPFEQADMKYVIGLVNSLNEPAMRFDKHLGFEEMARLPGAHDGGGDIVIMKMEKPQCRWLKLGERYEKELLAA